ncbi:MAG: DNA mismatch repair endonuclease MutL [Anaerolineales bacterium]|nr:DNA mismatch repair endonuclease MutL [Anaerolineales bacterium]
MPIRILSSEVASQIAAGEVVERPASVVKELVENALDAGAKSISITIEEAGRCLIEVVDDGSGIPADELALAVSRHATSKLATAKELFSISTLGFRGEALASIGSVSRMTITSRVADSATGARIRVEGGQEGVVEQVGAPVGTVVQVENLFYNVPARLKFLKADTTERRAIDTFITRYALAYPNVRFKLAEGKKVALQTAGDGDQRAILATLYGVDTAKQMLEVTAEDEGMKLSGFISPTSVTRSNRREMTFFINGRWVQDIPLNAALTQAYHTMLMVGRYPLAMLFLDVDPEAVDVNVHPAKAEVRFREQDKVFSFVQRAVRRALLAYAPVPSLPSTTLWGNRPPPGPKEPGLDWTMAGEVESGTLKVEGGQPARTAPGQPGDLQPATFNLPLLRLIGQIGATYLVAEGPDGLYLIDQHAAHERVLFEKLMLQHDKRNIPSQALLEPESVTLPPPQAVLLGEQLELLNHFGFQVEPFGPSTFQVRAMPTLFSGSDASSALRALVEDFEEDETPLQEELEARIAARVCKRMAVKAGQTLSSDEQRALLTDLENCDSPRTCPHGRPTMIHLSVDMLERQFGRKGPR